MRKMFAVAAALMIALAVSSSTQAGSGSQRSGRVYSNGYRSGTPSRSYRYYRGGAFDRLLEMERRKNAWLRSKFVR